MANWKKYTSPNDPNSTGYVNMDLIAEMITYKECATDYMPTGKQHTRLFTGTLSVACDSGGSMREHFTIEAAEPFEYFLQPSPPKGIVAHD